MHAAAAVPEVSTSLSPVHFQTRSVNSALIIIYLWLQLVPGWREMRAVPGPR